MDVYVVYIFVAEFYKPYCPIAYASSLDKVHEMIPEIIAKLEKEFSWRFSNNDQILERKSKGKHAFVMRVPLDGFLDEPFYADFYDPHKNENCTWLEEVVVADKYYKERWRC